MNLILSVVFQNVYFWIIIGALLAFLFAKLQQHSIDNIAQSDVERILSKTMAFSAVRVLTSVGILFLAFKTGLTNGLGCLITFIAIRWIWLLYMVKNNNIKKREV